MEGLRTQRTWFTWIWLACREFDAKQEFSCVCVRLGEVLLPADQQGGAEARLLAGLVGPLVGEIYVAH